MTVLTCASVQRRLEAFHDDELPIRERIAVQTHLDGCPPCLRELRGLEAVGDGLRQAAAPGPADDWTGLQPGVISRMRAEAHEAWPACLGRLFDDMHLVWIALAAAAGTVVCGTVALGLLHYASPERADSLAAIIATLAAPSGSDLNPMRLDGSIQVPTVPEDGVVSSTLERSGSEGELVLALAAVVTREGRISGLEVLANDRDRRQVSQLLDAISQARLEPARYGNSPIAVNLVWLVEHMTVKGTPRRAPAI
ncbi:MAG TPA: anti-sigma factor [Vicinamibacterales bacterium]|nr:anti-sigma factor [Vicinamibacterales bacterium]